MKLLATGAVSIIWLITVNHHHPFTEAEFLRPSDRTDSIGSDKNSSTGQDGAVQQQAQLSTSTSHEEELTAADSLGYRAHAFDRGKRALQLEGLYDFDSNSIFPLTSSSHGTTQHVGGKGRHHRGSGGKKGPLFQSNQNKWSRSKILARAVDDIVVNSDRLVRIPSSCSPASSLTHVCLSSRVAWYVLDSSTYHTGTICGGRVRCRTRTSSNPQLGQRSITSRRTRSSPWSLSQVQYGTVW